MITVKTLKRLGACKTSIEKFCKHFPKGARSWQEVADHPRCYKDWIAWIAIRAPGLSFARRDEFRRRTKAPCRVAGLIAMSSPITMKDRMEFWKMTRPRKRWAARICAYSQRLSPKERKLYRQLAGDYDYP